jgi:hypothetical protein
MVSPLDPNGGSKMTRRNFTAAGSFGFNGPDRARNGPAHMAFERQAEKMIYEIPDNITTKYQMTSVKGCRLLRNSHVAFPMGRARRSVARR